MTRPPRIDRPSVGLKRTPSERAKRSVPGHLRWLRSLPCVVDPTGADCMGQMEAAHIRAGLPANAKKGGAGLKPEDRWALPLCWQHHWQSHNYRDGEMAWWANDVGIDPVPLAEHLWANHGDDGKAIRAIQRARQSARLKQGVE